MTFGKVPAKVKRDGDGETFALAALGWTGPVPWNEFTNASPRVALRSAGKVMSKPKIEAVSGALPPVKVVSPHGEPGYAQRRPYAVETFPVRAASGSRPANAGPLRLAVRIGKPTSWVDLSSTEVITGRIEVIDDFHPDGSYGVRVIDLGAVRRWNYPGRLLVQNSYGRPSERVVGKHLERMADIRVRSDVAIDLPVLRAMHYGEFNLDGDEICELVLPALEQCKRIRLSLPTNGDAVFRAPKLAEGTIDLFFPAGNGKDGSLTVETALPATAFTINERPATAAQLARLGVFGGSKRR